jgi:hypothetical protein
MYTCSTSVKGFLSRQSQQVPQHMLFNFIDKIFPILAANISPLPIATMLALYQSKVSLRGSPGKQCTTGTSSILVLLEI